MAKRTTICIPQRMDTRIERVILNYALSRSETLRRLIKIGLLVVNELQLGNTLYSEDKDDSKIKIVFPDW